jgi:hypothetical protein
MEVLVYRTNIQHYDDIERIKPIFNKQTDILKWHVDLEDVDCVLRVEAQGNISDKIETLVQKAGYWCGELE